MILAWERQTMPMLFRTASLFILSGWTTAVTIDKLKREEWICCFRNCIGEGAHSSAVTCLHVSIFSICIFLLIYIGLQSWIAIIKVWTSFAVKIKKSWTFNEHYSRSFKISQAYIVIVAYFSIVLGVHLLLKTNSCPVYRLLADPSHSFVTSYISRWNSNLFFSGDLWTSTV
jgi:hypothetical protein